LSKYRHCRGARQCIFITIFLFAGIWARANAPLCATQLMNQTFRSEVAREWGYLDKAKKDEDKALKRKTKKLISAIQKHAAENGVQVTSDPKNSSVLLLKILPESELIHAHPFNRFATRLYRLQGIRVEINPLKLKLDDAGALFDDDTNRLTLAMDDILDWRSDSFIGHELRHAYATYLERLGIEHVFMGEIKRKPNTPVLQETYPDEYSFDELPAYYYQVIALLRETLRDSEKLNTAKDFLKYGLELQAHIVSDEVMQLKFNQKMTIRNDEKYQTVILETEHYTLEFNFLKTKNHSEEELKKLTELRLKELILRAQTMRSQFEATQKMLEGFKVEAQKISKDEGLPEGKKKEKALKLFKDIIDFLGSKRDVIDPKKVYGSGT
jgi:hypothetical protein